MIVNFNSELIPENEYKLTKDNRAFKYGDALFDTLKSKGNTIYFLEDHYFRLMASMRILRMDIPMDFTLEFYKNEILKTLVENQISESGRIRVTISRKEGGFYVPVNRDIDMLIEVYPYSDPESSKYEIELFKDFPVTTGLIGTLKTTNRLLNVVASIYAEENGYDNCLLINEKKNITEAINANVFVVRGQTIFTPPLEDGCIKGIIREKVIDWLKKNKAFRLEVRSINPFELLQADEVFLTNSLIGIQPVTHYRKKKYARKTGIELKAILEKYQL